MESNPFWKLVRHEFSFSGNRRKSAKRRLTGKWRLGYIIFAILIGFVVLTLMAGQTDFYLENVWFFSLGLPYFIFFMGYGLVKREWDNETQGWWLTLPYSRNMLIGAKFFGTLFRVLSVLAGLFVLAGIYGIYLMIIQSNITADNFVNFMIVGFNWIFIMACFCPLMIVLGITTAITPYTVLRPIVPILWFLFMFMASFIYWGLGDFQNDVENFSAFLGETHYHLVPYSLVIYLSMIASWILSYVVIRLLGYLLNKKLVL